MDVSQVEAKYGLQLPRSHVLCLADPADPIHGACDFLLLESSVELLSLVHVNEFLRRPDKWNRWPAHLVAFASNGCGDYFAYDLRSPALTIVYLDPSAPPEEALSSSDRLTFQSFDHWRSHQLELYMRVVSSHE
mgnify:CR=1 FL=1